VAEAREASVRLVLCEPGDRVAAYAGQGLVARGLATMLVTSVELCSARRWEHRVSSSGATLDVELSDGRRIRDPEIRAVLNRLLAVPPACLEGADPGDRVYAEHEWRALLVSALHGLASRGVPVVNEAHPYHLRGRWRTPGEWAILAHRAGFRAPAWRWDGVIPAIAIEDDVAANANVVVVGDRVFGGVPGDVAERSRRLAWLAREAVLGIRLGSDVAGGWTFIGADAAPDLRIAGQAGLDALADLLG
jgi:hypothetical protein